MASRRLLPSLLRSSSRRSACPVLSTPSPSSSTRGGTASAYAYLLNRTSEYATSVKPPPSEPPDGDERGDPATVGSTGQTSQPIGKPPVVDARTVEYLNEVLWDPKWKEKDLETELRVEPCYTIDGRTFVDLEQYADSIDDEI